MQRSRAADDPHEREARPLPVGGGGRMAASSSQPPLRRTPPWSLSSGLRNYGRRLGDQWRKRSSRGRRRRGRGGVSNIRVPQLFFVAAGCFFVAFPVFFVLQILARHAVFGDEGGASGGRSRMHEVPASFPKGEAFPSDNELVESTDNVGDRPGDGTEKIPEKEPPALELGMDATHDLASEISQTAQIASELGTDADHETAGDIGQTASIDGTSRTAAIGEVSEQGKNTTGSVAATTIDERPAIDPAPELPARNATRGEGTPAPGKTEEEPGGEDPPGGAGGDASPAGVGRGAGGADPRQDGAGEDGGARGEERSRRGNLRGSTGEDE